MKLIKFYNFIYAYPNTIKHASKKAMLLLNSLLTILVLEKVPAVVFAAVKPIIKTVDSSDLNGNKDIIMKISPDAIYKSFRAVVSSDYLQNLAEDFAQKAAAHFMTIIKKSEDKTFRQDKFGTQTYSRPPTNTKPNIIIPPVIKKKVKPFANKEELLVLLKEPAIDGDNLEQALSEEISETTEGKTARVKINGAYYKRHNQFDIQTISRPPNDTEANLTIPPGIEKKEEHSVKKDEVFVLLRDPATKEDNLEQALTKEISETTEGKARLQINGSTYYKKQNIVVSPDVTSTKEPKTTKIMEVLTTSSTTTEKPIRTTQIRVPTK